MSIATNWRSLSIRSRGSLLGLFFISVGMALNLGVLYTHLLWGGGERGGAGGGKMLVLYLLARLYGLRSSERMQFAGVLSQGGEFAFVLFSLPASQRLFPARPDGAAAGCGNVVDDDDAAADEGDR